jgi:hypothetical protein
MKYLNRILFLFLSAALVSCGGSGSENLIQQEDELAGEVMAIHDEVMPKTAEVNRLSRNLRSYYEANKESISEEMDGKIELMQRELEKAEDGMMAWMTSYQQPEVLRETYDHDAIMEQLRDQKASIQEVADQINTSIENAKALMADLPDQEN